MVSCWLIRIEKDLICNTTTTHKIQDGCIWTYRPVIKYYCFLSSELYNRPCVLNKHWETYIPVNSPFIRRKPCPVSVYHDGSMLNEGACHSSWEIYLLGMDAIGFIGLMVSRVSVIYGVLVLMKFPWAWYLALIALSMPFILSSDIPLPMTLYVCPPSIVCFSSLNELYEKWSSNVNSLLDMISYNWVRNSVVLSGQICIQCHRQCIRNLF